MVSIFSPNRGYEEPSAGSYVDTWGPVVNGNFAIIDSNISATATISFTSSNVTLNATQAQNMAFLCTGTLSANVSLIYPQTGGFFIVRNATAGSFLLSVITSAVSSAGVIVPQGQTALLYSDGTNIRFADDAARVPVGTVSDFAGTAAPTGWLLCDGSAVSRTFYASLFDVVGTIYGAGDGSTTFNVPDTRGRLRAGRDNMGGAAANRITSAGSGINGLLLGGSGGAQTVTLSLGEIPSHNHPGSVTDLQGLHYHGYLQNPNQSNYGGGPSSSGSVQVSGVTDSAGIHGHNCLLTSQGGSGAHNNMSPTIIFNTIIRAF